MVVFFRRVGRKISTGLSLFSSINFLTVVLAVLLFTRILTLYSTIDIAPKHIDENAWMHSTYFYHLFFQERDFFNEDWHNFISYEQPPVGKYILGFALHVSNHKVADTNGGLMNWYSDIPKDAPGFSSINEFRKRLSKLVDKYGLASDRRLLKYSYFLLEQVKNPIRATSFTHQDYKAGRMTIFIFGILATALLVVIGAYAFKYLFIGLLAGLVFLSNNVTIPTFQQVLPDSICCFFVLSSLFILFRLFRELSIRESLQKKIIGLAVLEGLFLSLALGTKFITTYMAVAVVFVFMTSVSFEIAKSRKTKNEFFPRRIVLRISILIIILAYAFAFFVLLNPFLYPHPIGNALKMARFRFTFMEMQSRVQGPAINSFSERIRVIYREGILLGYNFHNLLEELIYIFVFLVGAITLIKKSLDELSKGPLGSYAIVFLWVATTFIVNGLMIHMQWERYCIPFVMCTALILGLGVEKIINILGIHTLVFRDSHS